MFLSGDYSQKLKTKHGEVENDDYNALLCRKKL